MNIGNHHTHYIDGQWRASLGEPFTSTNPADGSIIWRGTMATPLEITAACCAARCALSKWSNTRFESRVTIIENFAKRIEARRQELKILIAKESGKPLWEAATEVSAVIGKITLSVQAYKARTAEKEFSSPDARSFLRYKPHGVVAVLGPFNFPAHLSNGHIVPALLAGNTIVYKPSEHTPAVAELVLECWHDSGIPRGVINAVQGGVSSAKMLLQEDIQGVYFTGSYKTGLQINQQFSDRPEIILALEMGGNNPLIVDSIENISAAVYHTLLSAFITAGQRCTCARRIIIPDNPLGDAFLMLLIKTTQSLRVGAYTNQPEPFIGPVISQAHARSHLKAQASLIKAGGHAWLSMSHLADNTGLLSPGIIDMSAVKNPPDEEIFAPLTQIYRYRDFQEALTLANQTRYGLAASLLSDKKENYEEFYKTIRAGLINWNRPTTGAASHLPFGGIGRSGNHRPSGYFAADYCAYPTASLVDSQLSIPDPSLPGIEIK